MDETVAVINHPARLAGIIDALLVSEGIASCSVSGTEQLFEMIRKEKTHLILVGLEGKNPLYGISMIELIRRHTKLPILAYSSGVAEYTKIMALNAGADDYILADDNPLVLMARIKAHLRRYTELKDSDNADQVYQVKNLELDEKNHTVTVSGRKVDMTPTEYEILRLLMKEKGRILSKEEIFTKIWQMKPIGTDNTIAVHMNHIRKKIEEDPSEPKHLKVVWGIGYKIE